VPGDDRASRSFPQEAVRMGVMDWMDGDEGEDSDTVATDGLGFDEDFDDLDGEMDDLDDGGMGGLDGEMDDFGDDMGGFDDGDDFGGPDIDADTIAEMEDRISELENEVSSVSSGMNTVREENKQIGETVEELDETIRKLLDIYEMVTRGINPFVDDAREMGGLEGDGAFGLFEMEEEKEENLDSEVANADAEDFFDEDFGDLDAEQDEAELAAEDELAEEEREDPGGALDDDEDQEAGGEAAGGSSFDDLKAEYEENDGWEDVEDDAEASEDDALDEETAAAQDALDEALDGDHFGEAAEEIGEEDENALEQAEEVEPDETLFEADDTADPADDAAEATASDAEETSPEPAASPEPPATTAQSPATDSEPTHDPDVYLAELPARYTAESVVLEWTRFLVDVGGAIGAARALRQYRSQGWITRDVERTMSEHVRNAATAGTTEQPRDLRVEHHRESLTYISRLAGDVDEARLLEELSALGGGSRGIRR
jgi:archaellum component FlaD/FlaE/archaellum component FlaC